MDYGALDSSGTDDDLPPVNHNAATKRVTTSNGRANPMDNLLQNNGNSDMESQIHWLEKEAYKSILRAFKAQSDAITWEKESLMTDLRKELRVSHDEHRELLNMVNADDIIQRIREWRQAGGVQPGLLSTAQTSLERFPGSIVTASHKKQRISQSVHPLFVGAPPSTLQSPAFAASMPPSAAVLRQGAPPNFASVASMDHVGSFSKVSSGIAQVAEQGFPGRNLLAAFPNSNYHEPVITESNLVESRIHFGDGRETLDNLPSSGFLACQNGNGKMKPTDVQILNTDVLVKEVERLLFSGHPDPHELERAKKALKDQERSLIDVISRLPNFSDG